jgi:hypothetical protein
MHRRKRSKRTSCLRRRWVRLQTRNIVLLRLHLRDGFQRIKLIKDISVIPRICTSSMVHTIVRLSFICRSTLTLQGLSQLSSCFFSLALIDWQSLFSYVRWYPALYRCPTTVLAREDVSLGYKILFIGSVLTGTVLDRLIETWFNENWHSGRCHTCSWWCFLAFSHMYFY